MLPKTTPVLRSGRRIPQTPPAGPNMRMRRHVSSQRSMRDGTAGRKTRNPSFANTRQQQVSTGMPPPKPERRRHLPRHPRRMGRRSPGRQSCNCSLSTEAAYESLDPARVRRFKPSFKNFPNGLRSTDLTISNESVVLSQDRQSATVNFTLQYRNGYPRGVPSEVSNPRPVNVTWRVQRTPTGWIILE